MTLGALRDAKDATTMTEKSAQAFRTISEVAEELDLPQHVLRFWETKFRQVSPMKRGGGRRYYRPEDVELLRRIKSLLHTEGYTIKGVQRLLSQGGVNSLPEAVSATAAAPVATSATPSPQAAEPASGDAALAEIVADLEALRDRLKKAVA